MGAERRWGEIGGAWDADGGGAGDGDDERAGRAWDGDLVGGREWGDGE